MSILFLAKDKPFARDAADLIQTHIPDTQVFFGDREQPIPSIAYQRKFDYILSYISPWILPVNVLVNAKCAAINFHPGPPSYPGIGCTNFALYNGESDFGVTVHHMELSVDSGSIISVEQFPIFPFDSVSSLTQRCYLFIYISFIKIFPSLLGLQSLPKSSEKWKKRPSTRKDLNELCRLHETMTREEVERRIHSVTYPGMPGAVLMKNDRPITIDSYEEFIRHI